MKFTHLFIIVLTLIFTTGCVKQNNYIPISQVLPKGKGVKAVNIGDVIYSKANFSGEYYLEAMENISINLDGKKHEMKKGDILVFASSNKFCLEEGDISFFTYCSNLSKKELIQKGFVLKNKVNSLSTNLKQELIYKGFQGNTLILTYREFSNDFAIPVSFQELSYDINSFYPSIINFKTAVIEVFVSDNNLLKYKILKGF